VSAKIAAGPANRPPGACEKRLLTFGGPYSLIAAATRCVCFQPGRTTASIGGLSNPTPQEEGDELLSSVLYLPGFPDSLPLILILYQSQLRIAASNFSQARQPHGSCSCQTRLGGGGKVISAIVPFTFSKSVIEYYHYCLPDIYFDNNNDFAFVNRGRICFCCQWNYSSSYQGIHYGASQKKRVCAQRESLKGFCQEPRNRWSMCCCK
jgi:hypothetical protein